MTKLDDSFLTHACAILAETNSGLSGYQIVEYCNSYAKTFNKEIPYHSYPLDAPNKRTALKENIQCFEAAEQFHIIKKLCKLPMFKNNDNVQEIKMEMFQQYGSLATEKISETVLAQSTKHWLKGYPEAFKQYENALAKFESGIFERNALDDMRLSFELLLKDLLSNNKSLENQLPEIGNILKNKGVSAELRNMIQPILKYYTDFQNNHVKHNEQINSNEIAYVIELTSIIMKFLIQMSR